MTAPVVLVPGLQSNAASWMPMMQEFCHHHPVCVPKGHQYDQTVPQMARRVLDQSPDRFHLVGWSMGGYIVLEMLRMAPERVISLAMIATTAGPEAPENLPRRQDALARARIDGMRAYQTVNLTRSILQPDKIDPAVLTRLVDASEVLGLQALENQTKAVMARRDNRGLFAGATLPTFVLAGQQDEIIPVANAREMRQLRPDAEYHELPECGHCPPLEYPRQVAQLLGDWLRGVPQ